MLIAVPSEAPGGLKAPVSDHFGHCAAFTIVDVTDGKVGEVKVVDNDAHEHGGCMAPVRILKQLDVEVLLAGGMGGRPLAGFQQVGIAVHFKEDADTVERAIELYMAGQCRAFGEAQTCGGGGGHCGGHDHEPVERAPIEGPADVREGRLVTMTFELRDDVGALIDSSEMSGPMVCVQGSGSWTAIEKAITGLFAGDKTKVSLTPAEGFGDRDESKVFSVPRERLPGDVEVGDVLGAGDGHGNHVSLTVRKLDDSSAELDANHPLAGMNLVFDLTVARVETATPEEIAHGHAH